MDIDYAKAVEMVLAARDTKPKGYVYMRPADSLSCMYVHKVDGMYIPGCLIGTAFINEGICTLETFDLEFDGCNTLNTVGSDAVIERIQEETEHRFTEKAISFLGFVQGRQDCGATWENAISLVMDSMDGYRLSDTFE